METLRVPAREGRGFHVSADQKFRVVTPKGQQAADFFAFNANNVGEWLSPNHTWARNRHVHLNSPEEGPTEIIVELY